MTSPIDAAPGRPVASETVRGRSSPRARPTEPRHLRRIVALLAVPAALALAPAATAAPSPSASSTGSPSSQGAFVSSDPLLNQIWKVSVRTARQIVVPGPLAVDRLGRPCAIDLAVVIVDGPDRDRCPYIGDHAVVGKTLLLANTKYRPVIRNMLRWFAANQHADGAIPASPFMKASYVLFDYNAYWIESLYDYVLSTGDRAAAVELWPNLVRIVDGWYASRIGPRGLLVNDLGPRDYAYVPRTGTTVAYYNAGYARALGQASQLATWIGNRERAAAWRARVAPVAAAFAGAFWSPGVGAFRDTTDGDAVYPQDGNAFAVLSGVATREQSLSALDWITRVLWRPYGSTMVDSDRWDSQELGRQRSQRVYPFIAYFEVLARYSVGLDDSALELVRRVWGHMVRNGPGTTMWETIGPNGSGPVDSWRPSWSHGWSTGAVPALVRYVLGVAPLTPGFATVLVEPRLNGVEWARGTVPTPRGPVKVEWRKKGRSVTLTVTTPVEARLTLPVAGRVTLNGKPRASRADRTSVAVKRGTHTLVVVR